MQVQNLSGTGQRIIGFLLLLPMIVAFWYSALIATVIFVALSVLMFWEFLEISQTPIKSRIFLLLFAFCISIWPFFVGHLLPSNAHIMGAMVAVGIAAVVIGHALLKDRYAIIFMTAMTLCAAAGAGILALPDGRFLVLLLAVTIASCDIAAYFVGRKIGGPKLAPSVSPNKTFSGAIGGVAAALMTFGMLLSQRPLAVLPLPDGFASHIPMLGIMFSAVLIGVLSQVGDLLESIVKRRFGVKDSGKIIPGHGGALDRFDGYLFTLPAMYWFLIVAR